MPFSARFSINLNRTETKVEEEEEEGFLFVEEVDLLRESPKAWSNHSGRDDDEHVFFFFYVAFDRLQGANANEQIRVVVVIFSFLFCQ